MSYEEIDIDIERLQQRMVGALTALRRECATLRTGRASASILDSITVVAYGSTLPISQCGTVNIPNPRMITISVWDKNLVSTIERAIRNSSIGINPVVDGMKLRLPIPTLTEQRRRELAKIAGRYGENARIAVRNVRKSGMNQVKQAQSKGMSEDEQKFWNDEIQTVTDKIIKNIDAALAKKQKEIMQV